MSAADTWMPLYIGDYLADTMHLTGAQHGAYLLMLIHQWRSGPLPDDDAQLAAIARTDLPTWRRSVGPVVRRFFTVTPEGLSQKRLAAERLAAAEHSQKRAAAGSRGAAKRWQSDSNAMAMPSPGHRQSDRPSPSPKKEGSEADASDAPAAAVASRPIPTPTPTPAASLFPEPPAPPSSPPAAPSIRDALWRDGVPILRALCGHSDRQARSALGRLLRDARDDCARLYAALREAESLRPADPMAWLSRAASAASRDPPHKPGRLDWAREEVARLTGQPRTADSAAFVDAEQWENVS